MSPGRRGHSAKPNTSYEYIMQTSAEMLIVFPEGPAREECRAFINDCIIHGIDFYSEPNDTLPTSLPRGIEGVRLIIIDMDDYEKNREALAEYESQGVQVHIFNRPVQINAPQQVFSWNNFKVFHQVVFSAALTTDSPQLRERMLARDDESIFDSLAERVLKSYDLRWYDSTCYNWNGLLDGYAVTGDKSFLNAVQDQVRKAIVEENNDVSNCDCVAPFVPVMRLYEITGEQALIDYVREKLDFYIDNTPKYKGCFMNFNHQRNHARAEILFQICPSLMMLSRITKDPKYAEVGLDQFQKLNDLLLDTKSGFWHHGVNDRYHSGAFWARGVAMVLFGILQILTQMEPGHPRYEWVRKSFVDMAAAFRALQDESGFWFHIVDNPISERETSGTSWIGASFERGIRLGYLDESYRQSADLAWQALKSRVWRGFMPGHAYATTVSSSYPYYLKNHLSPLGWTHFGFLMACERRRTELAQKGVS